MPIKPTKNKQYFRINAKPWKGKDIEVKILVTGANGYLGQGIVQSLLNLSGKDTEVIVTDYELGQVDSATQCIVCDLFAVENPYEYFGKPDALLHLAWKDGFVHYSDSHISFLPKHYLFIKKMVKAGIKQIAVMGSMHEIGFYEGSVDENTPCKPTTPYGISKNALRQLTEMLCKGQVTYQWLRGYYIVGNSEYGSSIFSKITAAEKEGKSKFPFTMGLNQFDFLDYDKFCNQVAFAVLQKDIDGIINICSGRPEKLADRVERFIADEKYNIKLSYGAFPDRPYDSKAIWGDDTKIQKILKKSQQGG